MLPYFKKYTIYVCIIAVALPLIASTIYPIVTGQLMFSTIYGLFSAFFLLFAGLFIGFGIFERKAEAEADEVIGLYNDKCDPAAFVSEGAKIAKEIKFPCNQNGSWFIGYYAQALLDLGRSAEAQDIVNGLELSVKSAKKPMMKAGIIANLVPLVEKIDGSEQALELISEGIKYCDEDAGNRASQIKEYLESQKKVCDARISGDNESLSKLDTAIMDNDMYPMRMRVEHAWDGASADYKLGDSADEKAKLEFVAKNGNRLALVAKAKARLASI